MKTIYLILNRIEYLEEFDRLHPDLEPENIHIISELKAIACKSLTMSEDSLEQLLGGMRND